MKIASEHTVSWNFVRKIESELYTNDRCVVSPEEITLDIGEPAEDGARIYCFGSIGLLRPLLLVPQEANAILEELRQ